VGGCVSKTDEVYQTASHSHSLAEHFPPRPLPPSLPPSLLPYLRLIRQVVAIVVRENDPAKEEAHHAFPPSLSPPLPRSRPPSLPSLSLPATR